MMTFTSQGLSYKNYINVNRGRIAEMHEILVYNLNFVLAEVKGRSLLFQFTCLNYLNAIFFQTESTQAATLPLPL